MLDKSLQEMHEIVAVAIDPIEQLLTPRVHDDLLGAIPIPAQFRPNSGATPACGRLAARHWLPGGPRPGLFVCPRSPMVPDNAISVILAKLQNTPAAAGRSPG